jgi:hypothetical protein
MRNQFDFIGIDSPKRRELTRAFFKKNTLPPQKELKQVIEELWVLPERDYQYIGVEVAMKYCHEIQKSMDSQ